MKLRKTRIHKTVCGIHGIMVAMEVYHELKKLPLLDSKDDTHYEIGVFTTMRAEGIYFVNNHNGVAVAVSENKNSDDIRILILKPEDFDKFSEENRKYAFQHSHGFHSHNGPGSEEAWKKAIFLPPGQHKRAAKIVAKHLNKGMK